MADPKQNNDASETESGSHLDALNDALEAEKADSDHWTQPAPAGDEGVYTSAPDGDSVGSLLTDLLNEAKKEVEKERASLHAQVKERADEQRLAKQRDESQRREELQRRLMEETRRRNEAMTRREREEAEERRLVEEEAAAAAAAAAPPAAMVEPPAPTAKPKSPLALIALAAIVAIGIGGAAFALQPKPEMKLPDIRAQVTSNVEKAALAWQARQAQLKRLAAEKAAAKAKAEAAALAKAAAEKTKAEAFARAKAAKAAAAQAEADTKAKAKRSRPAGAKKKRTGKRLKLNTSVF